MGTDDQVVKGAKDIKLSGGNRVIRDRIDDESRGMETAVFKWDHKIFCRVPSTMFIESVFHREPGRVSNTEHIKGKRNDRGDHPFAYSSHGLVDSVYRVNKRIGSEELKFTDER